MAEAIALSKIIIDELGRILEEPATIWCLLGLVESHEYFRQYIRWQVEIRTKQPHLYVYLYDNAHIV